MLKPRIEEGPAHVAGPSTLKRHIVEGSTELTHHFQRVLQDGVPAAKNRCEKPGAKNRRKNFAEIAIFAMAQRQ